MAICGISQPVYLPWVGYFNLILRSNKFVFLDDAQFSKNSYGNRNRIPITQGFCWLTIPILKGHLNKSFKECKFDETQGWRNKHLKTIKLHYGRSESFQEVYGILESRLMDRKLDNLADLSIAITTSLVEYLGVHKQFYRSSVLDIEGQRSEKIYRICKRLECDEYLSAIGSKEYIVEDGILHNSDLKVIYQNIEPAPYPQMSSPTFQSHMSIIDLLFNLKKDDALVYIVSSDSTVKNVIQE